MAAGLPLREVRPENRRSANRATYAPPMRKAGRKSEPVGKPARAAGLPGSGLRIPVDHAAESPEMRGRFRLVRLRGRGRPCGWLRVLHRAIGIAGRNPNGRRPARAMARRAAGRGSPRTAYTAWCSSFPPSASGLPLARSALRVVHQLLRHARSRHQWPPAEPPLAAWRSSRARSRSSSCSSSRKRMRALCNCDFELPIEHFMIAAISLCS